MACTCAIPIVQRHTYTGAECVYQIWYKNVIFCALNGKGKNAFNRCLSWDDRKCFEIIRFGSCLNCAFFVFLSFFRLFGCLFVCFWDCYAINLAHYPILWTKSTLGFYDACRMYKYAGEVVKFAVLGIYANGFRCGMFKDAFSDFIAFCCLQCIFVFRFNRNLILTLEAARTTLKIVITKLIFSTAINCSKMSHLIGNQKSIPRKKKLENLKNGKKWKNE